MYLDYMTYQELDFRFYKKFGLLTFIIRDDRMKQLELHLNQDSTFKIMLMLCFAETEGYDECLVIN